MTQVAERELGRMRLEEKAQRKAQAQAASLAQAELDHVVFVEEVCVCVVWIGLAALRVCWGKNGRALLLLAYCKGALEPFPRVHQELLGWTVGVPASGSCFTSTSLSQCMGGGAFLGKS